MTITWLFKVFILFFLVLFFAHYFYQFKHIFKFQLLGVRCMIWIFVWGLARSYLVSFRNGKRIRCLSWSWDENIPLSLYGHCNLNPQWYLDTCICHTYVVPIWIPVWYLDTFFMILIPVLHITSVLMWHNFSMSYHTKSTLSYKS